MAMKRFVLPVIILTLCLFLTSCGNIMQKTLPGITPAPETTDTAATSNGSGTVTFTGNIDISGAFPKEIADRFKNAGITSGDSARTAFPSLPGSVCYYVEVTDKTSGVTTKKSSHENDPLHEDFSTVDGTPVFSLSLETGHSYKITVSLADIDFTEPENPQVTVYLTASDEFSLTENNPVYIHDFTLNPVTDSGTGNVSLPVNVTANYSFRITKITNLKTGEDFPIVKFSVIYDGLTGSGNNVMYEHTLSGTDIPAGSYAISFEVFSPLSATANQQTQTPYVSPYVDSEGTEYPVGTMRTYFTTQTINVYKNMTTDTWFNNGNLPVDQNGEFSINAATSMNNIQTVFYVDGGVAQSGNGTYAKPFKTLNEAMFCITGGSNSGKPVYIHIKDGYQETFSDRYPVRASGTTYALEDNVTLEIECWKNTIGDGKGRATILTSGSSVSPIFDLNINRTATGPTVTLRGITLSGSGATNATGIELVNGNLTLENCQITGFQTAGINVSGGSLTVSGLTYITGNGTSGAISNVKLAAGKKISVGTLTSNSKIGVSLADEETEEGTVFTTGFKANNPSLLPGSIFTSDKTDGQNPLPVGYGSADDAARKEVALYTPGHGTITPDMGDGIRFALDKYSIWENASDTSRTLTLSIQDLSGNAVTVKDLHIKLLLAGDEIPGYDFTSRKFSIPAAVKAGYYQLKITATCNDIPQSATIDFEIFQAPLISSLSAAPAAGTVIASSASDLTQLATWVNAGSPLDNVTIILGSDVTISSGSGIGHVSSNGSKKPFSGTFDGQGHTVTLAITSDNTKQTLGLFGCISVAHIKNVTVTGTITASGSSYVGGIAGYSSFGESSIIENCICEVTISSSGSGSSYTGGLVGMVASDCTFINCINNGNISGNGYLGGIVGGKAASGGTDTVTLYNCVNNGTVKAVSTGTPGGLVGSVSNYNLEVINCANTGTVTLDDTPKSEVYGGSYPTTKTYENIMYLQNTGSGKFNGEQYTSEIHAETSLSAIVARLNSWIGSQSASSWTYRMWQVSTDGTKIKFMD